MMVALFNCILGVALSFGAGLGILHLDMDAILRSLLASQVGGLIGLLVTLRAERAPWIRANVLNRSLKTWTFFAAIYFGALLLISPALRDVRVLLWMTFP